MKTLQEKKLLLRMKQHLKEEIPQSLIDEIAADEAAIAEKELKQASLREERRASFNNTFVNLSSEISKLMEEEKKKTTEEQALLDRFANVLSRVDEIKSQIQERADQPTEEFIQDIIPHTIDAIPEEVVEVAVTPPVSVEPVKKKTIIDAAVEHVAEAAQQAPSMFVQPDPPVVSRDIKDIQNKLKLLEGWVGKISMNGPGGGAVWLRDLDDVARSSVLSATEGQVLTFNEDTKRWEARDPTGGGGGVPQVQSDWTEANTSSKAYIKNKPVVLNGANGTNGTDGVGISSAIVNGNGSLIITYSNTATANAGYVVGPAGVDGSNVSQIQTDWNQTNTSSVDFILNKPSIPSAIDDLTDVVITSPEPGEVLKYNGSYWYNGADQTGSGTGTTPGYYGSFYDTVTQTAAAANTAYAMQYNTTVSANEVTVDATHGYTRVYVTYSGVYNIQFSAQLHNTGGGGNGKNVQIWLRKNGVDVEHTNTDVSCDTNTPYKVAAWNFVEPLNSGDYFELMWATDNTGIILEHSTYVIDGAPYIPSVILTVQQVAAILIPTDITGTANNATHLGGVAANQYAYANQIAGSYTLPTANTSTLGGVKVDGTTITIAANGVISSPNQDLSGYQTTAGLSANVATLTANNTSFVGSVSAANIVSNSQLSSNLANYQTIVGLSANVSTLNANTATTLQTPRNINGVAFDGSANITITANASTLTGTSLNSSITGSALTSVGQLESLQISGGASVTNNSSTNHYANWGTVGQIFDDGQFHIHAKTGNMWINALDSSDIRLGTQYNSGSGSNIISKTPHMARTAWNAALNTETTAIDNFVYRVTSSGGIFPQFKNNTGGNLNCDWISVATISGTSITQTGSTGTIVSGGSWVTLYNNHGLDSPADMVITHLTDKGNGRVHRVTFMRNDDGATTGYSILVEKLW